jgi:hypothetical protein
MQKGYGPSDIFVTCSLQDRSAFFVCRYMVLCMDLLKEFKAWALLEPRGWRFEETVLPDHVVCVFEPNQGGLVQPPPIGFETEALRRL